MARRVYFAFHYEDVKSFRVNVVRQSWVTQDREEAGFYDASLWEKAKKEGDMAIKRLINGGLNNTSVTAVISGHETYSRKWVRYELLMSFLRGNGILNINIHNIKDRYQNYGTKGPNPLDFLYFRIEDGKVKTWGSVYGKWAFFGDVSAGAVKHSFGGLTEGYFSQIFPSYDWGNNDGYKNLGNWVEAAAKKAGR